MKILLVNKFLYPKGGDAISTISTGKILSEKGHEVVFWGMSHPENPQYPASSYFVDYVDYENPRGFYGKIKAGANLLYSLEAKRKFEDIISKEKPDIVHLNNFAHQLSPSILDVIARHGIPSVMTMHDYKLVCPAYTMFRGGKVCERCKGGRYYNCFFGRCAKASYVKSLLNTVEMYLHHDILRIYDKIKIFISPSRFLMDKVKEFGFKGKVVHLPNLVNVENFKPSFDCKEKAIVYVGRLSREKGIHTLIEAMKGLDIKLKIIGDGPMREEIAKKAEGMGNVEFLGYKKGEEFKNEIRTAVCAVLPSEWFENNPMSVMEAFALGKPVIGSRIGGIPELIKDGINGLLFEPGNLEDLMEKIKLIARDKDGAAEMGKRARAFAEKECTPERYYERLIGIYREVCKR